MAADVAVLAGHNFLYGGTEQFNYSDTSLLDEPSTFYACLKRWNNYGSS